MILNNLKKISNNPQSSPGKMQNHFKIQIQMQEKFKKLKVFSTSKFLTHSYLYQLEYEKEIKSNNLKNNFLEDEQNQEQKIAKLITENGSLTSNVNISYEKMEPDNYLENQKEFRSSKIEINSATSNKEFQSKLILFEKCSLILTKIFKGLHINFESFTLEKYEKDIIKNILNKKYSNRFKNLKLIDIENLDCIYGKIQNSFSKKRPEENNKFIYKNTLKIMIKNFFKNQKLKKNRENEDLFYFHYFSEISKKKNLPLRSFYDPLNVKQKVKTLNNKFLNLIFSSKLFKKDFFKTLENNFFQNYENLIIKKFEKFFWKFEKKRFLIGKKNQITNKLIEYLFKSKRVKFPWDQKEIEEAISYFKKRIEGLIGFYC